MKRIDILGAGPAGLAAAHFAKKIIFHFNCMSLNQKLEAIAKHLNLMDVNMTPVRIDSTIKIILPLKQLKI